MEFQTIDLDMIDPNPNQPRKDFGENALQELSESIKQVGVLMPLLVRPLNGRYEIVHGERRWRAAKKNGLDQVPARVQPLTDTEAFIISLNENLQRQNLNPIEDARAYHWLQDQGYTQEKIADTIRKSQQYVASRLTLLNLPEPVQGKITTRVVSPSHGEILASLKSETLINTLTDNIARDKMTVRQLEYALRRKPWLDSAYKEFDNLGEKPSHKIGVSDRGLVHARGEKIFGVDLKIAKQEAEAKATGSYIDEWEYSGMIPKIEANDYPILSSAEWEAALKIPGFALTYMIYWGINFEATTEPKKGDIGYEVPSHWHDGHRAGINYVLPCGNWGWGDFPVEEIAGSRAVKKVRRRVFIPYIIPWRDYAVLLAVLSGQFVYAGCLESYRILTWKKSDELDCMRHALEHSGVVSVESIINAMSLDIEKANHVSLDSVIEIVGTYDYDKWAAGLKERPNVFEYLREQAMNMNKKRWRLIMWELTEWGTPNMRRSIVYKDKKRFVVSPKAAIK